MTGADRIQLSQVRAAILGNRPGPSLSSTLYPVYVALIVAGTYGVPATRQPFASIDTQWLAEHVLTPVGAGAALTLVVLLLSVVRLLGRVRGPVVPPLPYLELVVASPMSRKVTLARYWRLSMGGSAIGGLLFSLVLGGGLAIAHGSSPDVLLPEALGGALLGVLVAEFWLRGQLHGDLPALSFGSGRALRSCFGATMLWPCWISPACEGRLRATSRWAEQSSPAICAPSVSTPPGPPRTRDVFG